eukprot:1154955-Pelagomonas_calceolata.AAC.14
MSVVTVRAANCAQASAPALPMMPEWEGNTKEVKNKGTQHASCFGVLFGHTYHIQVWAPAWHPWKVESRHLAKIVLA